MYQNTIDFLSYPPTLPTRNKFRKSNATKSLSLNNILDRDGIVLDRINQGRLSSPRSHLFILVSGATAIDF